MARNPTNALLESTTANVGVVWCYDKTGGGGSWYNPDRAVPDPNGKNGWKANSGCQTKAKEGEDCAQSFMCEGDLLCHFDSFKHKGSFAVGTCRLHSVLYV